MWTPFWPASWMFAAESRSKKRGSKQVRRDFLCSFSILAFVIALPGAGQAQSTKVEPDKQVFADYHVPRFTRQHDGSNGVWQFAGTAAGSRLGNTDVAYNPDLIDENGRREIAATTYPLAGVQSDLDPDYLEYQVLSAKWAHIDGFMVEWGFPGHLGNNVLLALMPVAQKYGLKIGINWCVSWAGQGMSADTDRESYLRRLDESADYILKTLYTAPNAARFGNRPVILIFGGNLNAAEFQRLAGHSNAAAGGEQLLLRLGTMDGGLANGQLMMRNQETDWYSQASGFVPETGGFFGWVPARLRNTSGLDAKWDREATVGDSVDYLNLLLSLPSPARPFLRMSSASAGFDNRPSAGWNKNDLSYLPRDNLAVYDTMWRFNIAHRTGLDWVLIPTWNDWTESSQIEPSVEDRGAALALTEQRVAELKNISSQPAGLSLPLRLFRLRKGWERVAMIRGVPSGQGAALDAIAQAISDRAIDQALQQITVAERELAIASAKLSKPQSIVLRLGASDGLSSVQSGPRSLNVVLPSAVAQRLYNTFYDGELTFDYRSNARSDMIIRTATNRKATVGDYSVVAKIVAKPSPAWRSARVRIYPENAVFDHRLRNGSDLQFTFSQPVDVRNVTVTFAVYAGEGAPSSK
jgi:hypothetical protein